MGNNRYLEKESMTSKRWKTNIAGVGWEAVFFLCYFLYIWLRIEPALYYQRQNPVFLTGWTFLREFLDRPGGFLEYASAFLSQGYYYSFLGALIVTAAAWLLTSLTFSWIRSLRQDHAVRIIHYLPAILLLSLHSQYTHPLAVSLALILSLLFVRLQNQIRATPLFRGALFLISACILYYAAAGALLLFALCCALYEAFSNRRPVLGAFYVLIVAIIPCLSKQFLFLINTEQAYLHLSLFEKSIKPEPVAYLLFSFYPILFILCQFPFVRRLDLSKRLKIKKAWLQFALQMLVLFVLAGLTAFLSYKKGSHTLMRVEYDARHERWEDLLRFSGRERSDLLPIAFQTNRALFHTGQLLENMFSYPQSHGIAGLMLRGEYRRSAPLQESDFCWDLGSINEARHWAYEAVSTDGESPWILKRMVTVNFVSGDFLAAERCLNLLDRTLFFKNWAKEFRETIADPSRTDADETIRHGRSMLMKRDYIAFNDHPVAELDSLLLENPGNRMAFEYRVAQELLSRRLGGLVNHIGMCSQLGYQHIPRHMAEAILALWAMSGKRNMPAFFEFIRPETFQRFRDFNQVMVKHGGDRTAIEAEQRQRFGDTYWVYMIYGSAAEGKAVPAASKYGGIE
jgi:hypothetical protein